MEERFKLKVVGYFLLGLIFNILGLILGGLWIAFKAKINRKPKLGALVLGFVLAGVIGLFLGNIAQGVFKSIIFTKFPELGAVDSALSTQYPRYTISPAFSFSKSFNTNQTTSTLSETLTSSQDLPPTDEVIKAGKIICQTLNQQGKHYDQISVSFAKSNASWGIFNFNTYISQSGTCDKFLNTRTH